MFEEFLYYWLFWIIFVVIYFFMDIGYKRSYLIGWILLMICLGNFTIIVSEITFSISFLLLLLGALIFYTFSPITFYKLFATFSVMVGYVSLLLWKKITPIWFFMPSLFMISVLSSVLILILVHEYHDQIKVALVSIAFGHLIYEFIVISYRLHYVVGERTFFIHISLIILFIMMYHFIQTTMVKFSSFLRKNLA